MLLTLQNMHERQSGYQKMANSKLTERVSVTVKAEKVIDELREKHSELFFHQSGGCCDGSAPMCFAVGEFILGSSDVKLGVIHGCDFYMAADQFEAWKNTHLTIDITKGRGSSFSLEIPLGLRFITLSRLFSDVELINLRKVENNIRLPL